jgi:hypothetical protein
MSFACNFDWIVSCSSCTCASTLHLDSPSPNTDLIQITYYGIPSAGVICVELLKRSLGHSSTQFSRSDAIQKLTLFIAFLEWVRPTDGNFALAQRLRKVVRRVLDHVLEPSQHEPIGATGAEVPFDPMFASFDDGNDLDWLNTIDWTQGSWMDFS